MAAWISFFSPLRRKGAKGLTRPIVLPSYGLTVPQSYRLTFLSSYALIITLFLLLPQLAFPQSADPLLSKFFAIQQDDQVLLRWTIRAGNTCEDTYIERSADGISWERIGSIGGICGSPDQPVTYEFYDTLPLKNQVNHYRLELGLYGYSSPEQAEFIALPASGYLIMPNPMTDKSTLIFDNPQDEEFVFRLMDQHGREVIVVSTTSDRVQIFRQGLRSGIYFITLEGPGTKLTGKLLVL
jgi:hypothetical protein